MVPFRSEHQHHVERDKEVWLSENKGIGTFNTLFGEVKCPWVEGLSYRINIGLNFRNSKQGSFTGTGVNNKDANAVNGGSVYENQTRNWAVENLLTFDRAFGKHNLNLVAMYSAEQTTYEQSGGSAQEIPADYFQYYALDKAEWWFCTGDSCRLFPVLCTRQSYWSVKPRWL